MSEEVNTRCDQELVEVAGYRDGQHGDFSHIARVGWDALMTVEQHERILGAVLAEVARLRDKRKQAADQYEATILSVEKERGALAATHHPVPALERREYPSRTIYPDASEFSLECAEITGWNAAVTQHERVVAALRAEIAREQAYREFLHSANTGLAEKVERLGDERDALAAQLAEQKGQEPVDPRFGAAAMIVRDVCELAEPADSEHVVRVHVDDLLRIAEAHIQPVAPAQQAVPEGWKLVPTELTKEMKEAMIAPDGLTEDGYIHAFTVKSQWAAVLAAAPQPAKDGGA
ncbi:hypothetical protein [Pseudomonas schmalbachii]|uniref:Phage protein n=1 Tax=Pseudomonas schmalbachii TaxID=2816993 RepID=A0ABS3TKJ5_9PSED|nr:hypothetical protein [Pseudomonas schmalbachii]MBO3274171.1 hypothetical protein [Pseudomonas schmalbachii]